MAGDCLDLSKLKDLAAQEQHRNQDVNLGTFHLEIENLRRECHKLRWMHAMQTSELNTMRNTQEVLRNRVEIEKRLRELDIKQHVELTKEIEQLKIALNGKDEIIRKLDGEIAKNKKLISSFEVKLNDEGDLKNLEDYERLKAIYDQLQSEFIKQKFEFKQLEDSTHRDKQQRLQYFKLEKKVHDKATEALAIASQALLEEHECLDVEDSLFQEIKSLKKALEDRQQCSQNKESISCDTQLIERMINLTETLEAQLNLNVSLRRKCAVVCRMCSQSLDEYERLKERYDELSQESETSSGQWESL